MGNQICSQCSAKVPLGECGMCTSCMQRENNSDRELEDCRPTPRKPHEPAGVDTAGAPTEPLLMGVTTCPKVHVGEVTPCASADLDPLLGWLKSGSAAVCEKERIQKRFTRGTYLPGQRLDLCKQSLGVDGARRVLDALSEGEVCVRHLLLGTDGMGDTGADHLAEFIANRDSLETVYLGCNNITSHGAQSLCNALSSSQRVRALWLKRNPIGVRGGSAVAALCQKNARLRTLDLFNCELGDIGVAAVVRSLHRHPTMERLHLSANGLTDKGMREVAAMLTAGTHIEDLYLDLNPFGDEGVKVLAPALRYCDVLSDISLANCGIQHEGALCLINALMQPNAPKLRRLHLGARAAAVPLRQGKNHLGDEGCGALARILAANSTLAVLNVTEAGVTEYGAGLIESALQRNTTLTELTIGQSVSTKLRRKMKKLLKRNRITADKLLIPVDVDSIHSVYRS